MEILIIAIFILGYLAIAFEHSLRINKTAPALLAGVLCWTVYIIFSNDKDFVNLQLTESLGEFAGILFFLMGAMTIVEVIDTHDGFQIITKRITQTSKRRLLWIISGIAFFLSAVLDNLTTAIVMVSLLQKIIREPKERLYYAGMIILASNAGGAWSPIGDVTTTMLWIGGQITAGAIIKSLFIPSVVSIVVPLAILAPRLRGVYEPVASIETKTSLSLTSSQQWVVLLTGIGVLVAVPVFKTLTHLPPYMGILIGLAILWIVTESIGGSNEGKDRYMLSPAYALRRIDTPSILFFLGILLCIAVLEKIGVLTSLASALDHQIGNMSAIAIILGALSAIVDNVPLVAATQGMYPLSQYPVDHDMWMFLAYATGTGGSMLIIGSAAGVAVMGLEKIDFMWYLRNITWIALIGYLAGAFTLILLQMIS